MSEGAKDVVRAFWQAMATNDFWNASTFLADTFRCEWPQSGEVIAGPANFAEVNSRYPANGRWTFDLRRIVGEGADVVTDVRISDGVVAATAVTFHRVERELIVSQIEYWPDPYEPPAWRAAWVEIVGEQRAG